MKLKFSKDTASSVAPDGVYKKGTIHDVHFADAQSFLENKFAEVATSTDVENKETATADLGEKREEPTDVENKETAKKK